MNVNPHCTEYMIPTTVSPNKPPQRYLQVDAFRAFALFGLFIVHCVELFELHWSEPKASVWFDVTFLLFAGKAFAMFALSFGLSFSIIISSANSRDEPYQARFLWRSVILVLFGLAHTIIYRGDILVVLGLIGMLLVPFNRLKSDIVLLVFAVLLLVNVPLVVRLILTYYGIGTGIPIMVEANSISMNAYISGGIQESLLANLTQGNLVKWLYMLESGRVSQILGLFVLGLALGRKRFFSDLSRFQFSRRVIFAITACLGFLLYKNQTVVMDLFPTSTIGETKFYISNLVKGWVSLLFMFCQTVLFFELWFLLRGRMACTSWEDELDTLCWSINCFCTVTL